MKNQKQMLLRVLGGVFFLGVFLLNTLMFVDKDASTGSLSIKGLEAQALGAIEGPDLGKVSMILCAGAETYQTSCVEGGEFCRYNPCP